MDTSYYRKPGGRGFEVTEGPETGLEMDLEVGLMALGVEA